MSTAATPSVSTVATPDVNTWYRVNNLNDPNNALTVGGPYDDGGAAGEGLEVFMTPYNKKARRQQWQFFLAPKANDSETISYVLRCRGSGDQWVLNSFDALCTPNGNTNECGSGTEGLFPVVRNVTDASAMWAWAPWNDNSGTYYLYNAGNGTNYIIDLTDPSTTTGIEPLGLTTAHDGGPGQRWTISSIGQIEDTTFSTLPSNPVATSMTATVVSTTGASVTATSASVTFSSTPTDAAHAGSDELSSGAKAGIGVGVIILVLIALLAGVWLFMRRRKRRQYETQSQKVASEPYMHQRRFAELVAERPPAELNASRPPVELNVERPPAELGA